MRAALHGFAEVGDAFALHQVMDMRHEHDPVSSRDAEQGDESDDRRDAEHAACEEHPDDAANQG